MIYNSKYKKNTIITSTATKCVLKIQKQNWPVGIIFSNISLKDLKILEFHKSKNVEESKNLIEKYCAKNMKRIFIFNPISQFLNLHISVQNLLT